MGKLFIVDQRGVSEALLEGAREVFETMLFMEIAEAMESEQEIEGWALLGLITFKGDYEGCLAICCNVECAKNFAVNMLALDSDEVGEEETCDAMGEIANVIMGSVKARLRGQFGNVEVSIPFVVSGRHLQNNLGDGATKLVTRIDIQGEHVAELTLLYRERYDFE